ncbi:hypothetical protein HD806DRAFT_120440 [Xylariaceae sp. AK1471]|nr:hypothetical protein HD806DRAFT_120440 [Xylariaceae sp. AK1471]
MNTSSSSHAMQLESGQLLLNCRRCYHLFLPFAGEAQARMSAAHPDCSRNTFSQPPHANPIATRKARKRETTRFSKRRKTYIKRTHDLSQDCGAQVYTVIRKNNNFWVYNSHPQDTAWPPGTEDIVSPAPNGGLEQVI